MTKQTTVVVIGSLRVKLEMNLYKEKGRRVSPQGINKLMVEV